MLDDGRKLIRPYLNARFPYGGWMINGKKTIETRKTYLPTHDYYEGWLKKGIIIVETYSYLTNDLRKKYKTGSMARIVGMI